jgi:uncharacterized protein
MGSADPAAFQPLVVDRAAAPACRADPVDAVGAAHCADATPAPRVASLRLGRRAERLMEFFLRYGPTHRLVAANIALRHAAPHGDRTTIGEIDFLLCDASGGRWHWELAVKFFLCIASGPTATAAEFIGPDRAETFDTKLRKLFNRQLRHTPPAPWNGEVWTPAACTRGWLFYRHGSHLPHTPGLHPDHLYGRWIERERLAELGDAAQPVWHIVPRNDWMCPQPLLPAAGMDLAALGRRLAEGEQRLATMVVALPALAAGSHRGADVPRSMPVFVVGSDFAAPLPRLADSL